MIQKPPPSPTEPSAARMTEAEYARFDHLRRTGLPVTASPAMPAKGWKAIPKQTTRFDAFSAQQERLAERAGCAASLAYTDHSAVAPQAFAATLLVTLHPAKIRPFAPLMRIDALPRDEPPPRGRRRRQYKPRQHLRRQVRQGR